MELNDVAKLKESLGMGKLLFKKMARRSPFVRRARVGSGFRRMGILWRETDKRGNGDSLEIQKYKRETAARLSRRKAKSHTCSLKEMIGLLAAILATAQDAMCASLDGQYADEKVERD